MASSTRKAVAPAAKKPAAKKPPTKKPASAPLTGEVLPAEHPDPTSNLHDDLSDAVTPTETHPTIRFRHRLMRVQEPNEAQIALLISAEHWFAGLNKAQETMGSLPADTPPDDPRVVEATQYAARGKTHVRRLGDIIASLMVDEEDWDWIADRMANRTVKWQEVAAMPTDIMRAVREFKQGTPANREERRAASRGRAVRG